MNQIGSQPPLEVAHITIGVPRDDGDVAILAALNNSEGLLSPEEFTTFAERFVNELRTKVSLDVVAYHRKDLVDFVEADDSTDEPFPNQHISPSADSSPKKIIVDTYVADDIIESPAKFVVLNYDAAFVREIMRVADMVTANDFLHVHVNFQHFSCTVEWENDSREPGGWNPESETMMISDDYIHLQAYYHDTLVESHAIPIDVLRISLGTTQQIHFETEGDHDEFVAIIGESLAAHNQSLATDLSDVSHG